MMDELQPEITVATFKLKILTLLSTSLLSIAACQGPADITEPAGQTSSAEQAAATTASEPLEARLANPDRPAEDRSRDASRKPAEVIAFLGIERGDRVLDLIAGGGYYTEVLSLAVGPEGSVSAQNPAAVLQLRDGANDKALSARLAGDRLPNVSRLDVEIADLSPDDGLYDAAITALNLHDIYNNYGEEAAIGAFRKVRSLLKPDGIFGVIDHDGEAGRDNKSLHRIPRETAVQIAESAGFVVEESSDILHQHGDDLTMSVFDESVRGRTHRFLLRLRKPAN